MATGESAPFELKGSLFTLTVLKLRSTELAAIDHHLGEKIAQAPGFFQNAPVIIDLQPMADDASVDFTGLYDLLRERGMIPVAVRNGSKELQQSAAAAKLPALPDRPPLATESLDPDEADATGADDTKNDKENGNSKESSEQAAARIDDVAEAAEPADDAGEPQAHYRLYSQPVRSGQQIYAPDGDLILLAPVSAGAEVIADGNIHVYAPLRGRALAGAKGDTQARIFCRDLEAELIAVAGNYRVIEKDSELWGESVQVYLAEGERLVIERVVR